MTVVSASAKEDEMKCMIVILKYLGGGGNVDDGRYKSSFDGL